MQQAAGAEVSFLNCDRMVEILRANMRDNLDAYMRSADEVPGPEVLAGSMLLALRGESTNAAMLAASYVGLKQIAADVIAEALN